MTNIVEFQRAKKAVILARVSSKEQEEGYSIDAQKHRLVEHCQRNNLEVVRIFEITESSTRGDRVKFMEMIKFCKAQRQLIAIVADKVDRVQRSLKEYPLLDALVQDGKIELHFKTEGYIIHRGSVSSEYMMWGFSILMAKSYTDNMRDNVKRSFDQKIRQGEYPTVAPIGYINFRTVQDRGDIRIDESRAPLVKRIFKEFAAGIYTLDHITDKAKEWGLRNKTKRGNQLHRSHLYKILNNPFYYGMMEIKGEKYPHRYPPLIDKRLFDKCQSVLKGRGNAPEYPQFKYGEMEFVFRGLLTCKANGRTVSSFVKKKTYLNGLKAEWNYLRSWDKDGKVIYVREDKVLEQAEQAFRALVIPQADIEAITDHLRGAERSERDFLRRQTDELKKEDSRIQSRVDGLQDLLMDGAITRNEYDRRRAQLRERQIEISNLLAAQRKGDDGFKDAMLFLLDMCNEAGELFKGSKIEEKRALLNFVLSTLELDGSTLCYSYRIPFSDFIETKKTGKWSDLVDAFGTSPDRRVLIVDFAQQRKIAA